MEVKIVKDDGDYIEVMLVGEDVGFANLISENLVKSKSVTFGASAYEHPLRGNPIIKIKAKSARKELKVAIEKVKDELDDFEKALKKELK